MTQFNGFTNGIDTSIRIHAQFFSEVLPLIDDLAELKVILFCYRALLQKQGEFRYLRRRDFANDADLQRGLAIIAEDTKSLLDTALTRAVEHGILLHYTLNDVSLYFMNTERGRTAIQQLEAGNWQPSADDDIEILPERPNIYTLYEENIGVLTPRIAEFLKAAETDYPYAWIIDAIDAALVNNARSWSYISAILERWKQEGRSDEATERLTQSDERDFTGGRYADYIES